MGRGSGLFSTDSRGSGTGPGARAGLERRQRREALEPLESLEPLHPLDPRDLSPATPNLWKTDPTPCLSVGNLAMGGRGKTPVTALVARLLVEAGERPAILSRGYRRRRPEDGVVIVSDGVHLRADLDRAGDEPLMLARDIPGAAVLVCEIRAMAAALATRALGATVLLLDDGFQHRSLRRDIDLVIVTAADLRDRRLPFGRLRSPVRALAAADAVLVDGDDPDAVMPTLTAIIDPARTRVFALRRALADPVLIDTPAGDDGAPARAVAAALGAYRRSGQPVLAMAGIAGPERFAKALQSAGWRVGGTLWFADHHRYSRADLDRAARAARAAGASLVLTTTKDAVRLRPLRPLPLTIAAVPLEVTVEPAAEFRRWVLSRLAEVRA